MTRYYPALIWAAVLIALPLIGRLFAVPAATVAGMAPVLTVLAVLHITSRGRGGCGAAQGPC